LTIGINYNKEYFFGIEMPFGVLLFMHIKAITGKIIFKRDILLTCLLHLHLIIASLAG
jgi:hypothetical protein